MVSIQYTGFDFTESLICSSPILKDTSDFHRPFVSGTCLGHLTAAVFPLRTSLLESIGHYLNVIGSGFNDLLLVIELDSKVDSIPICM